MARCGRCGEEREAAELRTLDAEQYLVMRRPMALGESRQLCVYCVADVADSIAVAFRPVMDSLRETAELIAERFGAFFATENGQRLLAALEQEQVGSDDD